jgi:hypothetical protein
LTIKVDDKVKKAEAEAYLDIKEKESPEEVPEWIQNERKNLEDAEKKHFDRLERKKKYFENKGLLWDAKVAELLDDGPLYFGSVTTVNGQAYDDLKEFKEKLDTLAEWYRRSSTKIGGLM